VEKIVLEFTEGNALNNCSYIEMQKSTRMFLELILFEHLQGVSRRQSEIALKITTCYQNNKHMQPQT
jgi:hypothetical protein